MCRIIIGMLVLLGSCGLSFSQKPSEVTVMIRVLDYKSGHPARDRNVALSTVPINRNVHDWVIAKTRKDGVASFTIKTPLPAVLWVDPEAGSFRNFSCTQSDSELDFPGGARIQVDFSGVLHLATSEVLHQGIVGRFTKNPLCQPHMSSIPPEQPGIIVIFTRHLNPWLTLRRFMHEAFNG
jgi:hypothetical protein